MAIGGGNKADWVLRTSIIGVNNTVTGTNGSEATDNFVAGVSNTVTNGTNDIVVGNNRNISGNHSVILGSIDAATVINNSDVVAVGHNTNVLVDGGVAIGSDSVASTAKGQIGYNASGNTTSTWKSTASAVSVGDTANNITRQITAVAAGTQDTDAVNVAQLRNVSEGSISQAKSYTDSQVSKVGAASAALAGLHPLDFNRNDKWSFSVGVGNYKNSSATAIGAFYRPNENTMFNIATTLDGSNSMISAGANFKFGQGTKKLSASKQVDLEKQVQDLTQKYNDLNEKYNALMAKLESK